MDRDLEKAAFDFCFEVNNTLWYGSDLMLAFKAGAEFEKNRIKIQTPRPRPEPLNPSTSGTYVKRV